MVCFVLIQTTFIFLGNKFMETYRFVSNKIKNKSFTQKIKCFFGLHDDIIDIEIEFYFVSGDCFGVYNSNHKCLSCNTLVNIISADFAEYISLLQKKI